MDAFQAVADPSRRRLLDVLRRGELAVNDLVTRLAIHQSGVSRHLRILTDAGFVQVRPEGAKRFYALRPEPFRKLEAWIAPFLDVPEPPRRRRSSTSGTSAYKPAG
jgi:DNA-binding transcriptional ArsR family regulator